MAYASSSDVGAWCSNLINGASDFSASTLPTQTSVNNWLSSGCAIINARLQAKGYAPPASGTILYDALREINSLYGAARAELARTNTRLAPGERSRGQVFSQMFDDELSKFVSQDLGRAGLSYVSAGYVGGVSQSDKTANELDGDRVPERFKTDQFHNPGSSGPAQQERGNW